MRGPPEERSSAPGEANRRGGAKEAPRFGKNCRGGTKEVPQFFEDILGEGPRNPRAARSPKGGTTEEEAEGLRSSEDYLGEGPRKTPRQGAGVPRGKEPGKELPRIESRGTP